MTQPLTVSSMERGKCNQGEMKTGEGDSSVPQFLELLAFPISRSPDTTLQPSLPEPDGSLRPRGPSFWLRAEHGPMWPHGARLPVPNAVWPQGLVSGHGLPLAFPSLCPHMFAGSWPHSMWVRPLEHSAPSPAQPLPTN